MDAKYDALCRCIRDDFKRRGEYFIITKNDQLLAHLRALMGTECHKYEMKEGRYRYSVCVEERYCGDDDYVSYIDGGNSSTWYICSGKLIASYSIRRV